MMASQENGFLLYLRSQYAFTDGRLMRYLSFMRQRHLPYKVFCWDRSSKSKTDLANDPRIEFYGVAAQTGGRYANAFKLIAWNVAIFRYCVKHRGQIKKIHCADFDSVLPCFLFARLWSVPLIFDSYDRYSDSRLIKKPVKLLVDWLESYILQQASTAILPAQGRIEQYKLKETSNLLIIENVPLFTAKQPATSAVQNKKLELVFQKMRNSSSDYRAVLSYVGILEPVSRGLEHLLASVAKTPDILLVVAGDGPLRTMVEDAAEKSENIHYVGAVDYQLAESLMASSDLHIGLYYLNNPNHRYAAPNKYYEHLYFGKPLLTSKNTPPGRLVEQHATGFTVADGEVDLLRFLENLSPDELSQAGQRARNYWIKNYENYNSEIFSKAYASAVSGLTTTTEAFSMNDRQP